MLRTLTRDTGTPLLIWLPAHDTLEKAGNWLTDRIKEERIRQGHLNTTFDDAEDHKTSGSTDWVDKHFLTEWCQAIASHVRDYVTTVRDSTRLPQFPALEVVVTGGSSAVPKVRDEILGHVKYSLKARGIGVSVSEATQLVSPSLSRLAGGYSEIQCAQLAVSFGASHPRFTELKHYPRGVV